MILQKVEEIDWVAIRNLTVEQRTANFHQLCAELAAQAVADGEVADVAAFGRGL
jgi:hypothetical protein